MGFFESKKERSINKICLDIHVFYMLVKSYQMKIRPKKASISQRLMRLVNLAGEKKFGEKWSMKSSLERECSEIAKSLKILKQMDPKLRSRVTVLRYEVTNWSYYGYPYSKKYR